MCRAEKTLRPDGCGTGMPSRNFRGTRMVRTSIRCGIFDLLGKEKMWWVEGRDEEIGP